MHAKHPSPVLHGAAKLLGGICLHWELGANHGAGCYTTLLDCCGQPKYVFVGESGCGNALLQVPTIRETLDILSEKGIQIAILGCDHHLALYRAPATLSTDDRAPLQRRRPLLPAGY